MLELQQRTWKSQIISLKYTDNRGHSMSAQMLNILPVVGVCDNRISTVTILDLPMVEVWHTYRVRADCEDRIEELKADFALDAFNLRDFWTTAAVLGFTMLAYNPKSLFRQAVLRSRIQNPAYAFHSARLGIRRRRLLAQGCQPAPADGLRASPVIHGLQNG